MGVQILFSHIWYPTKIAFLMLSKEIIRADGRLAPREQDMMEAMQNEMLLPREVEIPAIALETAACTFDTQASRVATMLKLTSLCLSDGESPPEEETLLNRVGQLFEFGKSDLLGQRDWVFRQFALSQEATLMMMEMA